MKNKKLWIVAALCSISTLTIANNLLTEDFTFSGLLTDNGWISPYGSSLPFTTTNGLTFDGYAGCNVGNAAVIDCNSSDHAHHQFNAVQEGDLYIAFMFQPTIVAKDGWFFCLRDAISTTTYNFNARVWINTSMQIGLTFADNAQKTFDTSSTLSQGQIYLVVLKYSIKSGDNNDQVSLYLLDQYRATEPTTPTIGPLTDSNKADINPENIILRGYDSNSWLVVDGIRIGTTWTDAVAPGNCESDIPVATICTPLPYAKNGILHITTELPTTIQLMDINGRTLTSDLLNAGQHTIPIPQGIYLLTIGNQTYKIVSE